MSDEVLERARLRLNGGGGYDSEMSPLFAQRVIDQAARLSKVREVINELANECPSHHMTGVDPMCDSCRAKNEENPYWPALTAIIEAMRP